MCHCKVISGDRERLCHHPPLSLVENILLVAAVKLLNRGEELISGNPANHRGDPVDDSKAVLRPGDRHVGKGDPLLLRDGEELHRLDEDSRPGNE